MIYQVKHLPAGLHFLATPIGNARDITLRALDILASADVLAAEDTRTLRKLMEIHGVPLNGRHIYAYHDHNGAQARPRLIALMQEGKSVAYASEAGTPLVADPGFVLCREALAQGIPVTSAPGPSAMIAALTISGLPSDRFLFAGFPPSSRGARLKFFTSFAPVQATLGFYESPKRIHKTLGELCETLGGNRPAALCRELTKRFEEVRKGSLAELEESLRDSPVKGEIVLLVGRAEHEEISEADLEADLRRALETMSVKDAAAEVAEKHGLKKRDAYQMALAITDQNSPQQEKSVSFDFVGYDPVAARQTRGRMAYEFGHSAEACVARHYEAQGHDLAHARWRGAGGEIDLIFRDGDGFIFVEVKASKTLSAAAAHLRPKQISRICASAEDYIGQQPKGLLTDMRIDVALVDASGHVEILENALM